MTDQLTKIAGGTDLHEGTGSRSTYGEESAGQRGSTGVAKRRDDRLGSRKRTRSDMRRARFHDPIGRLGGPAAQAVRRTDLLRESSVPPCLRVDPRLRRLCRLRRSPALHVAVAFALLLLAPLRAAAPTSF